jgi:hypothetical protein
MARGITSFRAFTFTLEPSFARYRCTQCDYSVRIPRAQNALARHSKGVAAIRRHALDKHGGNE